MSEKTRREITVEEVSKHQQEGDLWVIIDAKVYDLSKFALLHPGGRSVLFADDVRGKDATDIFYSLHRSEVLLRPQYARLQIGVVPGQRERFRPLPPGSLSPVPYGEPQWLSKPFRTPYFSEGHYKFQKAFRKLMDEVIIPEAIRCEANGKKFDQKISDLVGDLNVLAMRIGPGKHLKGRKLLGGILEPEEFDYFHELIINQEIGRSGQRGFIDGFFAGMVIAVPTLLNYGGPAVHHVIDEVLSGRKYISLAISEAFAGSDVAGLRCTAKLTQNKKHWIVNGTKKWITNGHFSDYFSTACRTDKGLTMMLIPRGEGVETNLIKTSYSTTANTAFVTFDNVKVPVEYTLGEVNNGLKVVLSNFNHERWMMACIAVQTQRNVVDETLRWTNQRIVFGKPLIEQAVVRAKIAQMISRVESCQTWLENITYQMNNMNYSEMSKFLAGPIGLLKAFITRASQDTARDATQASLPSSLHCRAKFLSVTAITQTGMGSLVELYHRTVPFDAILGGAEDVLADLGVRQAQKFIPKHIRL
ncbi:peroxisomal acyl-CoA-dehydrogenase [Cantharellus anzutake]|uniref:peroxisomal acyl-CoA-dehydrogenase n=1 Tax=Cantharellus anzutake TaxID=1750568 RepID=UPI00190445FB|nr:peroxisomal acyl-CoA-dehydrogenase [Cantharellus anzutake]KAF8342011.1 peroxisomal acyl-CoA-dehydrogenase [Cantharellus anzutake]